MKQPTGREMDWVCWTVFAVLAVLGAVVTLSGCAQDASPDSGRFDRPTGDNWEFGTPGKYERTLPFTENEIQFRNGELNDTFYKWELDDGVWLKKGNWRVYGGSIGKLPSGRYVLTLHFETWFRIRKMPGS